jgi:hypothetical protein
MPPKEAPLFYLDRKTSQSPDSHKIQGRSVKRHCPCFDKGMNYSRDDESRRITIRPSILPLASGHKFLDMQDRFPYCRGRESKFLSIPYR